MQVFVARQPILDRLKKTYAYELLFRDGPVNRFTGSDPDQASRSVIDTSFFLLGIDTITGGKPAFVNFTRNALLDGYATVLPTKSLVVEVLEDVTPDLKVIEACRAIRKAGHLIALDDVVYENIPMDLLPLANIVKVDFALNNARDKRKIVELCQPLGIRLLAEKVETQEEFSGALDIGYHYFQGFFFSKPVMVSGRSIPSSKLNLLQLLQQINRPDTNFLRLESIIKHEVSLTYKLLHYMNRVEFAIKAEISSVQQALIMLGEVGIKKWLSIVLLADMGAGVPPEVVTNSVVRAKLCESVAGASRLQLSPQSAFLMGLFSHLDALLERPMEEVLAPLSLPPEVRDALFTGSGELGDLFRMIQAYERGDWPETSRLATVISVDEKLIPEFYFQAMAWGNSTAQI
jgi:c-di-GMP-related signal transduction protein